MKRSRNACVRLKVEQKTIAAAAQLTANILISLRSLEIYSPKNTANTTKMERVFGLLMPKDDPRRAPMCVNTGSVQPNASVNGPITIVTKRQASMTLKDILISVSIEDAVISASGYRRSVFASLKVIVDSFRTASRERLATV